MGMKGILKVLFIFSVLSLFFPAVVLAQDAKPSATQKQGDALIPSSALLPTSNDQPAVPPDEARPPADLKTDMQKAMDAKAAAEAKKNADAVKPPASGVNADQGEATYLQIWAAKSREAEWAKKLSIGSTGGYWQPGANLQLWYMYDHYNSFGSGDQQIPGFNTNTFKIRRADITVNGQILPNVFGFWISIDPADVYNTTSITPGAKGVWSIMDDIFVTYITPYAELFIGQFKIPVSWEGYNSSTRLLFPERAISSNTFGNVRKMGFRVMKRFKYFMYWAGVYNVLGQNIVDNTMAKDITGRFEVYPIQGLMLGLCAYSTVGEYNDYSFPWNERYEADIRFEKWGFLFQGEYIFSHQRAQTSGLSTYGNGFYAAFAYKILEKYQFAFRFGQTNTDTQGVMTPSMSGYMPYVTYLEGAFNYYILKDNVKIQSAYSRFDYGDVAANWPTDNRVIISTQLMYY